MSRQGCSDAKSPCSSGICPALPQLPNSPSFCLAAASSAFSERAPSPHSIDDFVEVLVLGILLQKLQSKFVCRHFVARQLGLHMFGSGSQLDDYFAGRSYGVSIFAKYQGVLARNEKYKNFCAGINLLQHSQPSGQQLSQH